MEDRKRRVEVFSAGYPLPEDDRRRALALADAAALAINGEDPGVLIEAARQLWAGDLSATEPTTRETEREHSGGREASTTPETPHEVCCHALAFSRLYPLRAT